MPKLHVSKFKNINNPIFCGLMKNIFKYHTFTFFSSDLIFRMTGRVTLLKIKQSFIFLQFTWKAGVPDEI